MRFTCWALVLFQCVFLNVFVPLHTRGAVTLAGKSTVASCCARPESDRKHETPTPDDKKSCAVCYLVSAYVPVTPVVLELQYRELVRQAHDNAVAQVQAVDFHIPFWASGPPVAR